MPPNVDDAPKPTSSRSTTSTLGAPAGGRTGSILGNSASGSLASSITVAGRARSEMGNTTRRWSLVLLTIVSSFEYRLVNPTAARARRSL